MKKVFGIFIVATILLACNEDKIYGDSSKLETEINIPSLIDSLYIVDQNIQWEIMETMKNGEDEKMMGLYTTQKKIFKRHIPILKAIYQKIGYPTIDKVGEGNSSHFFTLVQHSDSDPLFQKNMLKDISKEVTSGNVSSNNFALLTDRVEISQQNPQVYGTQIEFDTETAQVFSINLFDSINVNQRRELIGLEPIEEYLNKALKMHFKMNKTHYENIGIFEPKLYNTK